MTSEAESNIRFFDDLDRALEWCEEELLVRNQVTVKHMPLTLQLQLADLGFEKANTLKLKTYLEPMQLAPQETLIQQNDDGHGDSGGGNWLLSQR